jgi:lysophospholipase L1-like esterase
MISVNSEKYANRRKQRQSPAFQALWPLFSPVLFLIFFSLPLQAEEFKLSDGDRIVLIGSTLIEREQDSGYWETALTSRFPKSNLTFRNLGWSGDTVFCDARAMFDPPAGGFQHLKEDLARLKPTVIILGYGTNESFEGEAGLPRFRQGLVKLLEMLAATKARIIVLGPPPQEWHEPPLLDPARHNHDLELYRQTLRQEAKKRGHNFVDLGEGLKIMDQKPKPRIVRSAFESPNSHLWYLPLTDNGLHFNDYGYWRSAELLERSLCGKRGPWSIEISKDGTIKKAEGVEISKIQSDPLRFEVKDTLLPTPFLPILKPIEMTKVSEPEGKRTIRVTGFTTAKNSLWIDGRESFMNDGEWFRHAVLGYPVGSTFHIAPEFIQVEKLRQTIIEKNRLFFHRWRPQNETYLFGFRKHEQGQNAREIPEFDPLIIELEKKIAQLRVPAPHKYELTTEAQRPKEENGPGK